MSEAYPEKWKALGLSISPSIHGYDFKLAVKCHWFVTNYIDSHPMEISQLFSSDGKIKYFEVLDRVEFEKGVTWEEIRGSVRAK